MEIGSDIVGIKLKEYTTVITWRQTTNYAASVGDMNPRYFDDLREGGIIARPMFAVALFWPVQQNILDYMEMPYPPEVFRTMVHYTEYIEFFRPIRPGGRLCARGEVAAVIPQRSGTRIVFKFPVTDTAGKPFHTEYISAMLRGVGCRDSGRGAGSIPVPPKPGPGEDPAWGRGNIYRQGGAVYTTGAPELCSPSTRRRHLPALWACRE